MDVLIQAHPSRAHLLPRIHAELPHAQVVWDPEPDGVPTPWRAYAACLRHVKDARTLIIQDDAVPAEGLSELLDEIPCSGLTILHVNQQPHAVALLLAKHHQPGKLGL